MDVVNSSNKLVTMACSIHADVILGQIFEQSTMLVILG